MSIAFLLCFFVDYDVMRLKSGMKVVVNIKLGEKKSAERIDGVVATIVALDRAIRDEGSDVGSISNKY